MPAKKPALFVRIQPEVVDVTEKQRIEPKKLGARILKALNGNLRQDKASLRT
jgi:hypothetical protein